MGTHARLSASSADRFMECPGSIALSSLLPAEESEYAAEGTAAHALAERCLREGIDAWELDGVDLEGGFKATPEMGEAVQTYLDYVRSIDGTLLIEHRIENPELGEDFGGTSDAVVHRVTDKGGFIQVVDYKHGAGIPVETEGNAQLLYYAFGVLKSFGIVRGDNTINVGISIVQPRAAHSEGPIRETWLKADDVLKWGEEELLPAMQRVNDDPTSYKSGEHCFFCPARLVCPVLQKDFNAMAAPADPLEALTDAALAEQYDKLEGVKRYIKALEEECFKRAMQGAPVPGTKLVYGRATREWNEGVDALLAEHFGEDAFNEPALKSPAQVEKLPGGKQFASEHSFKREGRPSLVPADKKGITYDPADAGAGFAGIDTTA